MTTFNEDLGHEILDQIKDDPESWQQMSWGVHIGSDCGTVACVAGWAAHFTGWTSSDNRFMRNVVTKGDRQFSVRVVAQEELGLTDGQTLYLFDGVRDLEDIEEFLLKPEVRAEHEDYRERTVPLFDAGTAVSLLD